MGVVKALASGVCWRIQGWSEGASTLPEDEGRKKQWEEETCRVFTPFLLASDRGYDQCPPWLSVGIDH